MRLKSPENWLESGYQNIWLPYTQMQHNTLPLPVIGAKDSHIILGNGDKLIDGIASWWSMCHGYQHAPIIKAISKQAAEFSHVMFAGLAHQPAYSLASKLAALLPGDLSRVFFAESGSVSVEIALKMAVQYWRNKGINRRSKFVCFKHSYHGDTAGAMSVSGRSAFNSPYQSLTSKHYVIDIPHDEYSFAEFSDTMSAIESQVAAIIIEPLVQCAGGFRFYSADILSEIKRIASAHDILLIVDEIATGFGRLGTMFACEEAAITPDIICVGKALTGGHVPLAATVATPKIFEAFLDDSLDKAFMHGPTFMANPIACAAALASLESFEKFDRLAQVEQIEQALRAGLQDLKQHPRVRDVRVKGALGVVELQASWDEIVQMREAFLSHGVWLRPFGDTLYIMPPFTINEADLAKLISASHDVLKTLN
jgi:adenosylmethionine-8-amino-7-oxononanoate aminotransferase